MNDRRARQCCAHRAFPIAALILLSGCSGNAPIELSVGPPAASEPAAAAGAINLRAVDRHGYDRAIAEHRGKVVFVDFWATWCAPCIEQFPHTVELAARFGPRGLAIITVSCDEPRDADRVEAFLRERDAGGLTNLISLHGTSSRTMEEFEIATGAVPYYKLYDRAGRLRRTFGMDPVAKEQFTLEEMDVAIEELLAQ